MKKSAIWLVIILLIAAFFRFYDIQNTPPGLWSDEAMNGTNAMVALATHDWKVFYPENFGREGLFINIQSLFVAVFGNHPWALRLPSAIFGTLTVLGLYLMVRELFTERIALFAAFFLATSFWHINFSRIGFRAIMAPFFLVWSFYFLFLAIRHAQVKNERRSDGEARRSPLGLSASQTNGASKLRVEIIIALAGFLFGLGAHSYIAYRIAPLIALLPLWKFFKDWKNGNLRESACAPCLIALFIFMALVAASPLLIYYAQHPTDFLGRTSAVSIFSASQPLGQFSANTVKTLQMFNLFGDFNWRHNFAGSPELWWPVGILFLLGIWLSLRPKKFADEISRRGRAVAEFNSDLVRDGVKEISDASFWGKFPVQFTWLWFIIMILPVALSNESIPHALRSIVLIPPAMIFAALGLDWIIIKKQDKLAEWKEKYTVYASQLVRIGTELKILFFIFLAAAAINAYNTYFNKWAADPNVYRAFEGDLTEKANWLNAQPSNIKKYIITSETDHVDVTGSPMSLQPIIFITNTFFENDQTAKNIHYITLYELNADPARYYCSANCVFVPAESDPALYRAIKNKIPGLKLDITPGFITFKI